MGRASVAAEIVIELTGWSKKMRDPRRRSYSDISAGCRCTKPTETGRQWLPAAPLIRVTKRIKTKSVICTTFGMVTG